MMMTRNTILCVLLALVSAVQSRGLMLLYRPRDISSDCAFSQQLRYDVSFGMGMSDTITLVLRTMSEIDYECQIDIVTERNDVRPDVHLLVVVRFPNNIGFNCLLNPKAFILLKKDMCFLLCDQIESRDIYATYYATSALTRFRFRFISNSSINSDMNANLYEVTATSARKKGNGTCNRINETICIIDSEEFCFTSGVVCDGIKNCGANDWFDERKSECELPMQRLGLTPVVAVGAVIVCAMLAAIHILLRCLPPLANSFFIFNANEDNRFCIDAVWKSPGINYHENDNSRRKSLIPVFSSSSSTDDSDGVQEKNHHLTALEMQSLNKLVRASVLSEMDNELLGQRSTKRKNTMRSMSEKIQRKLRSVTGRRVPRANHSMVSNRPTGPSVDTGRVVDL